MTVATTRLIALLHFGLIGPEQILRLRKSAGVEFDMKTWQQRMLNDFKKIAAFVERGVITKTEFIWQTLGMFAYYGPVDTGLIPELWPLVPESVRGEVSCAIREAASAATPWTLSGLGRDKTADDIQAERQSVKDWSQALLSHLETVPRCSGPV